MLIIKIINFLEYYKFVIWYVMVKGFSNNEANNEPEIKELKKEKKV